MDVGGLVFYMPHTSYELDVVALRKLFIRKKKYIYEILWPPVGSLWTANNFDAPSFHLHVNKMGYTNRLKCASTYLCPHSEIRKLLSKVFRSDAKEFSDIHVDLDLIAVYFIF